LVKPTGSHRSAQHKSRPGDLIRITGFKTTNVIVESLHDDKVYIEVKIGCLALLVERFDNRAHVFVNGFLGWVFDDEWFPETPSL